MTIYLKFGLLIMPLVIWLVFISLLIVISFIDFHYYEIYDFMSIALIVFGLVFSFIYPKMHNAGSHTAGLIAGIKGIITGAGIIFFFRVVGKVLFKKEAMGAGDVILAAGLGAFLGWTGFLFSLFAASILGVIIGLTLRIIKGQEYIPFGPYLAFGAISSIFFAEKFFKILFRDMV